MPRGQGGRDYQLLTLPSVGLRLRTLTMYQYIILHGMVQDHAAAYIQRTQKNSVPVG